MLPQNVYTMVQKTETAATYMSVQSVAQSPLHIRSQTVYSLNKYQRH